MITLDHFRKHGKRLYLKGTEAFIDNAKYPVDFTAAEELAASLICLGTTDKGYTVYENAPNGKLTIWQVDRLKAEALLGVEPSELCWRYKIDREKLDKIAGKEVKLAKVIYLRAMAEKYTELANQVEARI